jgi:hypothetical protein
MQTVFRGFYVERTIHIHVQAYTNWNICFNSAVVASNIASTSQLFFDKDLSKQIMALEPYIGYTQINITTNNIDSILAGEIEWLELFH